MNNLFDELAIIESEIDKFTDTINDIRAQMTARISNNTPMTAEEEDWFRRAGIALHINKEKLRKLNIKRDRLNREIKAYKKQHAQNRWQLKNSLFYAKLKELMPEEELITFLEECYKKVDEEFSA